MRDLSIHIDALISGCLKKDQKSYFELYHFYYKPMYNVALRLLKNPVDAEDIMQESFLIAFNKLTTFRLEDSEGNLVARFGMWLKRIVINNSINQLKKNKKYIFTELERIMEPVEDISNEEIENFDAQKILKSIQELKPKYQIALTLNLIEGYDYEEISQIMKLTNQNVRTIISRAKSQVVETIINFNHAQQV